MNSERKLRSSIALGLLALFFGTTGPATAGAGQRWALILAPDSYAELAEAPFLSHGVAELREALAASGFPAENVVYLRSPDARSPSAATCETFKQALRSICDVVRNGDVLLVVLAGRGVHLGGVDYVCPSDASLAEIRNLAKQTAGIRASTPETLIPVLKGVVEQIAYNLPPSASSFLLIDTGGNANPIPANLIGPREANPAERFGDHALRVQNGPWTVCNRSSRLESPDATGRTMTSFMGSALEGLTDSADNNDDQHVSVLEFSEYIQSYAEVKDYTPPVFQGVENQDFHLAVAAPGSTVKNGMASKDSEQLAQEQLQTAFDALLLTHNPDEAFLAAEQAEAYAIDPDTIALAQAIKCTARAAQGNVPTAWKERDPSKPLMLVAPVRRTKTVRVRGPLGRSRTEQRVVHPTCLLAVTDVSDTQVYVEKVYDIHYSAKGLIFVAANDKPGRISKPGRMETQNGGLELAGNLGAVFGTTTKQGVSSTASTSSYDQVSQTAATPRPGTPAPRQPAPRQGGGAIEQFFRGGGLRGLPF